ncbi:hypothetical protein [Cupriavidus necator]
MDLPKPVAEAMRYPAAIVEQVLKLSQSCRIRKSLRSSIVSSLLTTPLSVAV